MRGSPFQLLLRGGRRIDVLERDLRVEYFGHRYRHVWGGDSYVVQNHAALSLAYVTISAAMGANGAPGNPGSPGSQGGNANGQNGGTNNCSSSANGGAGGAQSSVTIFGAGCSSTFKFTTSIGISG